VIDSAALGTSVLLIHSNNKHAFTVASTSERRVQGGILGARRQGQLPGTENQSPALRLIYAWVFSGLLPFKNLICPQKAL
jgi:hypothetical protein